MNSKRGIFVLFAAVGLMAAPAFAKGQTDVDIEGLKADLYPDGEDWTLRIRYDVEVERAQPDERFLLALQFSDDGYRIRDAEGRPMEVIVPLEFPVEAKRDKQVFKDTIEVRLPGEAVRRPYDVRVHAGAIREGGSPAFDTKETRAAAHLPVVVIESRPQVVEIVRPAPVVHVIERRPVVHVVHRAPRVVEVHRPRTVRVVRW